MNEERNELIPSAGSVARKVGALANRFRDADMELKRLMTLRYGEHDEMPDSLVEVIEYGAGKPVTAKYIEAEMIEAGFPPQNRDYT